MSKLDLMDNLEAQMDGLIGGAICSEDQYFSSIPDTVVFANAHFLLYEISRSSS
jgi:hypothetical protein